MSRAFSLGERLGHWVARSGVSKRRIARAMREVHQVKVEQYAHAAAAEKVGAEPGPGFVAPNMDVEPIQPDEREQLAVRVAQKIYGPNPSEAELLATHRYLYPATLREDDGYGFTDLSQCELPTWEVEARALEKVARWADQPDVPTGHRGLVSSTDLRLRAAARRAGGPFEQEGENREVVLVLEEVAFGVQFEDGGQAASIEISSDDHPVFARLHSWVEDGNPLDHHFLQELKHSRIRVTVERVL